MTKRSILALLTFAWAGSLAASEPTILFSAHGYGGSLVGPAPLVGTSLLGIGGSLEWQPEPLISFSADYRFTSFNKDPRQDSVSLVGLSGRAWPVRFGGLGVYGQLGGSYNLETIDNRSIPGRLNVFAGLGVRYQVLPILAVDAGAQYDIYTPRWDLLNAVGGKLAVVLPLNGTFGSGPAPKPTPQATPTPEPVVSAPVATPVVTPVVAKAKAAAKKKAAQ